MASGRVGPNISDQKASASLQMAQNLNWSYLSSSALQCRNLSTSRVLETVLIRNTGPGARTVRVELDGEEWKETSDYLVLKLSSQPRGRISEGKRLAESQKCVKRKSVDDPMPRQSPRMLHSEQVQKYLSATHSGMTGFFERERNSVPPGMRDGRILLRPKLVPIKTIKQGDELLSALIGVVKGKSKSIKNAW